jgi:acetoin utilization protein AcuC
MLARPLFLGSEIYRASRYGATHPLGIPRVSAVIDLCRALGWLDSESYVDSPTATPAQLARFHDPDYLDALQRAEHEQRLDEAASRRWNIGRNGNPIFGEIFRRPATACGASLKAIELLASGGIVHSPAGGTHHGRRDQASGFCYLNDPVLAILAALDRGAHRVAYLDIDAHHGDGVELALAGEKRVRLISLHEEGLWPRSGRLADDGGGNALNLPLPAGLNDSEFRFLLDEAVLPALAAWRPELLIVQSGADALADDPMSELALSNRAYWAAIAQLMPLAPRLLVLGGGGYNPWSVARCWSGIWATLNGIAIPTRLPDAAEAVLRGLHWNRRRGEPRPAHWFTTLADAPNEGALRREVEALARAARGRAWSTP